MKKQIVIQFGARIKKLRMEKNISQEKLAELANFHRTYIGMIERGERNPSLTNVKKFADVFNMNLSELFKFS